MSPIRFSTKYDYFIGVVSIACFIFILLIYRSPSTIALASLVLILGLHKAFGRRIVFRDEDMNVRNLISNQKIAYSDVRQLCYTTKLYGNSYITIFCEKKNHKALLSFKEWQALKPWMENKGIECKENR